MIEVQILIPMTDNQGQAFDRNHDDVFIDFLTNEFGGCSQLPGSIMGSWKNAGVTYHDQNRIFMVVISGMLAQATQLRSAVDFAKSHYEQLAIYVRYLGQGEIL